MGDHYCCGTCFQRYDFCKCHVKKQPTPVQAHAEVSEVFPNPESSQSGLDDIRYFHAKLQRYGDVKTAKQLILAVEAFIKSKD